MLERLGRKNKQIERRRSFAFLAHRISPLDVVASRTESIEASAADGQNNNDKRQERKKGIKIAKATRVAAMALRSALVIACRRNWTGPLIHAVYVSVSIGQGKKERVH